MIGTMLREVSQGSEGAVMVDDGQRRALLRGIFASYYNAIHPTRTVFDTHRAWSVQLHFLSDLFPNARVICCVRHIPWILDIIEHAIRRNNLQLSRIFNFEPGGTIYSRSYSLMANNGMVGFALEALKHAMHSAKSPRILLLPYEMLTRHSARAMRAVYEFTDLPHFEHDFENVAFDATAFDAALGTPGLHTVRPVVTATERETILPPDLWQRYEGLSIWRDPAFNTRGSRLSDPVKFGADHRVVGASD